ncbi:MAG: hypothetical protein H6682_11530 [Candidatus Eisenbacteria bacterium]|nr:hypothetical protein [Candidatus Eisenbacteria bacterium]
MSDDRLPGELDESERGDQRSVTASTATRAYGLDRQPIYVKMASTEAEAKELRAEYILARRLAGSTWQDPVAYRRYRTTEFMMTALANARSLAEGPRPKLYELPGIIFPILEALRRVHALGYTYVDLKPEHVFVDNSLTPPRVTLIDLGGCVPTGSEARMYTAGYSAPEAIGGGVVDERSDLYSFGAILSFLLTGEDQFQGETIREVLAQQFLGDPSIPSEGPVVLGDLLRDLLSSTPRHRPDGTREVERRLHQLWPRDRLDWKEAQPVSLPTLARDREDGLFRDWLERIDEEQIDVDQIEAARTDAERVDAERGDPQRIDAERVDADGASTRTAPRQWTFTASGERGIGLHRCLSVWLAEAEARGWVPNRFEPADSGDCTGNESFHLTRYDRVSGDRLVISLVTATPNEDGGDAPRGDSRAFDRRNEGGRAEAGRTTDARHAKVRNAGARLDSRIEVGLLSNTDLARLASVQLESTRLGARLARLSLGNPGLLAALLPQVGPVCDFLNTGPIQDRSYEDAGASQRYVDWCRDALGTLSPEARDALVEDAAANFLRYVPDAFLDQDEADADSDLDLNVQIGPIPPQSMFVRLESAVSERLWAEAVLRAAPDCAAARTRHLVKRSRFEVGEHGPGPVELLPIEPHSAEPGRSRLDRTGVDAYRLATLAALLRDDELLTEMIPLAVHRLLDEVRWRDAGLAFSIGMNASETPLRILEHLDLPRLTIVLAGHCTGSALSAATLEALRDHARGRDLATREAAALLAGLGRKEQDRNLSIADLSGPRPTTPEVEQGWLLYRIHHWLHLWHTLHRFDIGADPLYQAIAEPLSHGAIGDDLHELGFGDDPRLPSPMRRELLFILTRQALMCEDFGRVEEYTSLIRTCSADSLDPLWEPAFHQHRALLAYERGAMETCQTRTWASLRSQGGNNTLSLTNLALLDLDGGRLGSALRLTERAIESLRLSPNQQSYKTTRCNTYALLARLGQAERIPPFPDDLDLDDGSKGWLEAEAHAFLPRDLRAGRARIRRLMDADLGESELVDQLADWALAEVDLGNREFALELAKELDEHWRSATDRCAMKVRLASCTLELSFPGRPKPDLERLIEVNYDELVKVDWHLYAWRAVRNRALFLEKVGAEDRATRAWRHTRRLVDGLLASFGSRQAAEAFERTAAIQAFYRDSRRRVDDA